MYQPLNLLQYIFGRLPYFPQPVSSIMPFTNIDYQACTASNVPRPSIFGTQILHLSANIVANFSQDVPEIYNPNHPAIKVTNTNFCNVTITYTHPGQNDTINTEVWLPTSAWNGRLLGVGGGGWSAGRFPMSYNEMAGAIGENYVGVTTDSGLGSSMTYPDWAQVSPGNVNLFLLQDLATVTLNESAYMAKDLAKSLYGQPPRYSYFSGCSQGGRQGMALAQRYPNAYDGIAASAPAINWSELITNFYWPQLIMNLLGQFPRNCELAAITAAAIAHCDGQDGVVDGLISDVDACDFDPFAMANQTTFCADIQKNVTISEAAVKVANETWTGSRTSSNSFLWYGLLRGADLTEVAGTSCSANGTCFGTPLILAVQWMQLFITKQPDFDPLTLTIDEFSRWTTSGEISLSEDSRLASIDDGGLMLTANQVFRAGVEEYTSIIGTKNPDLSDFRLAGGKLIAYHGLADVTISPHNSRDYYDRVTALDNNVHDFYRHFEVPGLGHCYGSTGAYPYGIFDSLVAWVENGTIPETLTGYRPADPNGVRAERLLCPYPTKATYDGKGEIDSTASYKCSTSSV